MGRNPGWVQISHSAGGPGPSLAHIDPTNCYNLKVKIAPFTECQTKMSNYSVNILDGMLCAGGGRIGTGNVSLLDNKIDT